jgi:predicted transcriptional regulator
MQAAREGRTIVIPSAAPSSAPVETPAIDADQVDVEGSPAALDEYESPAAAVSQAASDLIGKLSKAKGAESRQKVLDALQNAGTDGATRLELEEATEMSRAAVLRHVKELVDAGQATRDKKNRIRSVVNEVAA